MSEKLFVFAVACLVAFPVVGGNLGAGDGTDDPRDPHRALRDAVQDIRVQYAPFSVGDGEYVFRTGTNRPGLGIIVRGGAPYFGGEARPGAEILAVTPGSPADEAGLQPGDVVIAWNGEPLAKNDGNDRWIGTDASRDLVARSRELDEGDAVVLRYLRDGEELEVNLVAREIDFGPRVAAKIMGSPDVDFRVAPNVAWKSARPWFIPLGWLDMELVEINPELGAYFGSDAGVLVVRGPEGDDTLGLASGDVILRIGDREVKSPEHAMRILRSYEPDEELSIDIIRHGKSETLAGTVPDTSFRFDYRFGNSEDE